MHRKIHIVNGPNLNLLGRREPEIYGSLTFEAYLEQLRLEFPDIELAYYQSNHEGQLIDYLQDIGFDAHGIVFNPAAYTHTSIALADTVKAITSPVVEVHISDIMSRESFRHVSYVKPHCVLSIVGKGLEGYREAVEFLLEIH